MYSILGIYSKYNTFSTNQCARKKQRTMNQTFDQPLQKASKLKQKEEELYGLNGGDFVYMSYMQKDIERRRALWVKYRGVYVCILHAKGYYLKGMSTA